MVLSDNNIFVLAVLSPFLAAALAPFLTKVFGHLAGWVLALVPVGIFVLTLSYADNVAQGSKFVFGHAWVPTYGVRFSYYLDGLSLMFALLVSGIGALIVIYTGGYLKGHRYLGRFFSFMLLFMGSMLGVVLADNLITLFVYWELTSITSFLLIGFDNNREASRRAALQALLVTGGGGLSLLAGFLLISATTGIVDMSHLLVSSEVLKEHPLYLPILVLILGGAFTKSAQFPMHFWLPNAMEAPTPVSAYLHSATMVKAGVYLLMRMHPVLGDTVAWTTILPIFGGATLLVGTLLAVRQTDLKLMLAYTTVASLGLLVMLTGTSIQRAIEGAVLYLFAHSLFKGGLFMVAGTIDHEAGTRDITKLGGLRKAMPITFVAAGLAALSMAGIVPFIGFVAKEVLYDGVWGEDARHLVVTATAVIGNALMLVIAAAVAIKPFLGGPVDTPKHAHEGPVMLWLGPLTLASLGLLAALFSSVTGTYLVGPVLSSIVNQTAHVHLHVLPDHVSIPLLLSLVTIALGIVLFLQLDRLRAAVAGLLRAIGWGPDKGFDQFVRAILRIAIVVTRLIQPGRMQTYMVVTFAVIAVALFVPMVHFGELPDWPVVPPVTISNFDEWAIVIIAMIGLVAVLKARTRLIAIVSLGIQGFAVALIFMLYGAPDLSFTQFMVETLSVVILALVMTRLNVEYSERRPVPLMFRDGIVALVVAIGFGLLMLRVTQFPFDSRLSDFFAANSRVIAHGRNIVNVIIVDFRGLDTLGEIAVVMITGLAILALIRIRAREPLADGSDNTVRAARTHTGEKWGGDVA